MAVFIKKEDGLAGRGRVHRRGGRGRLGNALHTIFGKKIPLEAGHAIALHWAINSVKKGGIVSVVGVYGPTGNRSPSATW
jgi:threonine dehydrogenase-like Zn-dependent dehydrogenase